MEQKWNKILAKEALKNIYPEQEYSAEETIKLIPWINNWVSLMRIIKRGVLKATLEEGENKYRNKWHILGSDLATYIKNQSGLK